MELATAGAAKVLGTDHGVTMAFAKAAESMAPADLWLARIAIKTLRRDQREAIAAATENEDQSSLPASRLPGARLCARLVMRGRRVGARHAQMPLGLPSEVRSRRGVP